MQGVINFFRTTPAQHVQECFVEVKRHLYLCGMWNHLLSTTSAYVEFLYKVSRDQCTKLQRTVYVTIERVVLDGNKNNATTSHNVELAAHVSNDGDCKGEYSSDSYDSWDKAVMKMTTPPQPTSKPI